MNPRFQRISELFEQARQIPDADARARYLEGEDDADLRREVETLLAAHEADGGADPTLDSAVLPGLGRAVSAAWESTQGEPEAPELVEGFRILRLVGSGGMGTVYAAEQADPQRLVALKVLRPEADRDRFRREALALARLQHPGIAQILLTGECTMRMGRVPFLAMELIEGEPIDRFARKLDRRARIELLIRVCEAVAHAHQRGVIHRDLKPSNILVGADGRPKVLDFGLAMATDESDDDLVRRTQTGHLVGTLAYMSPEQAAGRRDAIDTRSDVYALGVLAYEMLTGRLPHALQGLPIQAALARVTGEDPDAAPDLKGDLWVVVRKALARDPDHRYAGPAAFAADLRRYLAGEPVTARPPSALYHMRKFVGRHKAGVAVCAALLVGLVGGLVLAVRAADREAKQRRRADAERDIAHAAAAHAYLKAAAGDFATHNYDSAAKNLEQVAPAYRDWEWDYLQGRLDRSLDFVPFPPDVDRLDYEEARVVPDSIAELRARLCGHSLRVEQDLEKKTARVFDTRNPDVPAIEFSGVARPVRRVLLVPQRQSILLLGKGTAHGREIGYVFGADGGAPRFVLPLDVGTAGAWALDPTGTRLAYGGYGGALMVYDVTTGTQLFRRRTHSRDAITSVAFDGAGHLASGGSDRAVQIQDAETGELQHLLRGHTGTVTTLAYASDGSTLVSGAYDGTIRVWDPRTARTRDVIPVPNLGVRQVALDASGHELWADCTDGFRRWRIDEERLSQFRFDGDFLYAVAFHPDGRTLAIGGFFRGLRIVDAAHGRVLKRAGKGRIWGLAFAPNGDLYSPADRYAAPEWDLEAGERVFSVARAVAISPDGSRVAGGGGPGSLRLYRPADRKVEAEWSGIETRVEALDFSADGKRLAIVGTGGFLQVRSVPDGAIVFAHKLDEELSAVAFHPTGRYLACAGKGRVIRIWDLRTGTLHRQLEGHRERIWCIAYNPSGTRLVSGAHDATIRIWDPETGLEKLRLEGHDNYIYDLDFSPDGKTLVSASGDFTARIWSTRTMLERWAEADE